MEPPSSAPPPYESVMQDTGGHHFFAAGTSSTLQSAPAADAHSSASRPSDAIAVTDPLKLGDGVGAYVCYKVQRTTPGATPAVVRRFRDFTWLQSKLQERHKGVILPPLPEKSAVHKLQMDAAFIEMRRAALQVFLNRIAAHPVLREAPEFGAFLTAPEAEWQMEMARWQAETTAAAQQQGGAWGWIRSLQHSAQNMVSGRSDDAVEDAEYIKVRDYINSLEAHLTEAQRQVGRLSRKEAELAGALAEFAHAGEQLGKFDDGALRASFDVLCSRAGQIAAASRQRADALAVEFEAPLHEFARSIKSVQVAMADRAAALSAYVQAKGDLDGKKVRLAKLRGTPGLKEDKISEAEREVTEAEQKVRTTKLEYDSIASRMTEELNRYQKERSRELNALLKDFALTQARCAAENARAWSALLQDIQQQQQQQAGSSGSGGGSPPAVTQLAG